MNKDLSYDRTKPVNVTGGGGLATKSGIEAGAGFTGNPRTKSVVFSTAFIGANYSPSVVGDDNRTWNISNRLSTGFDISSNSGSPVTGNVYWTAIYNGET